MFFFFQKLSHIYLICFGLFSCCYTLRWFDSSKIVISNQAQKCTLIYKAKGGRGGRGELRSCLIKISKKPLKTKYFSLDICGARKNLCPNIYAKLFFFCILLLLKFHFILNIYIWFFLLLLIIVMLHVVGCLYKVL